MNHPRLQALWARPHDSPRLRRNNFDLVRLVLAGSVCLAHTYVLSRYEELKWLSTIFSSTVAVQAFFVVSGFLIFMSYERSASLRDYAGKRLRRIYPAYFTVVVGCALVLGAFSVLPLAEYVVSPGVWKYLVTNLAFLNFLQPSLPGVFEGNPEQAINGALWTIKVEVMFYLVVPLLVLLFRRITHLAGIVLVYLLSIGYAAGMTWMSTYTGSLFYLELGRQLPGQLSYFMGGAALYYFFPFFERRALLLTAGAAVALTIHAAWPLPLLQPIALAILVIFFGTFLYVGRFGRWGDFSYGVYILHFPIIQSLVALGWKGTGPWSFLLTVVAITVVASIAMWHLVEKRFLARTSHYIETARP